MTKEGKDARDDLPHPIQPVALDPGGVLRFKANKIVSYMLEAGRAGQKFDMNTLAIIDFPREDRIQLTQLIGYSVDGAADLSYMDRDVIRAADAMAAKGVSAEVALAATLIERLSEVREKMREGVAELYGIHPDDLGVSGAWRVAG